MTIIINRLYALTGLILFFIAFSGCSQQPQLPDHYRGVLETPGGPLAFPIHIQQGDSLSAYTINAADTVYFSDVVFKGDSLIFSFDYYDSHIRSAINNDGSLSGSWSKRSSSGRTEPMPFYAKPGESRYPITQTSPSPFDGEWDVTFTEDDGETFPARGVFYSRNGHLYGTFVTETGDYRFLEGTYTDTTFTLSTFDGPHAFLFEGALKVQNSDTTITGDFWSGMSYHADFEATKGAYDLQDPYSIAELTQETISFSFKNPDGEIISSDDPQFQDKPVLLYLFGSWCPNCADEARMLKEFYQNEYKNTDLQIVGLAFEYTGDFSKDAEMVSRYKERFNIPWPLLIAGISDKQRASEVLPFIKKVTSYPTAFFADRNHKIQSVHVGFKGPGTGSYYLKEKEQFKQHLDDIVYDN